MLTIHKSTIVLHQSTGSTARMSLTGHWMLLLPQRKVAVNSLNWLLIL